MNIKKFFLFLNVVLIANILAAQSSSSSLGNNPFRGTGGVVLGWSSVDTHDFELWLNQNGRQLNSSNYLNIGLEGFIVRNHLVVGLGYYYEGLANFTPNYYKTSPQRDKIGIFIGGDPMDESDRRHLLFTLGIGYAATTIKFHDNPPDILENSSVPDPYAKLEQNSLWLNPKLTILYVTKIKFGVDLGASFYFSGNYKYGYDYTYYSYGYNSNGQYVSQSHTTFIGYPVFGIPYLGKASFNVSAYIGL